MDVVYLSEDYSAVICLTTSELSYVEESVSSFYTEWKKWAEYFGQLTACGLQSDSYLMLL